MLRSPGDVAIVRRPELNYETRTRRVTLKVKIATVRFQHGARDVEAQTRRRRTRLKRLE